MQHVLTDPSDFNKKAYAALLALGVEVPADRQPHDLERSLELLGLFDVFVLAQRLWVTDGGKTEILATDLDRLRGQLTTLWPDVADAHVRAAADRVHQAETLLGDVAAGDPDKALQLLLSATARLFAVSLMTPQEAEQQELVGFGDEPIYGQLRQVLLDHVLALVRTAFDLLVDLRAKA